MSAEAKSAVMLLAPAALLLSLFLFLPALGVLILSFTDWELGAPSLAWIGLENYQTLAADPIFMNALGNTLRFAAMVAPGALLLGLGLALLLRQAGRWGVLYQAAFLAPVMASTVAMAIAWEFALNPRLGGVNALFGMLGLPTLNWLGSEATALPTLAVLAIWQMAGVAALFFLSALGGVSADLYDAAAIDGADSSLSRFLLVTWPQILPIAIFLAAFALVRSLQTFEFVQVLTRGDPNGATDVLMYQMYKEAFGYLHAGYGSAITVVILALAAVCAIIQAAGARMETRR